MSLSSPAQWMPDSWLKIAAPVIGLAMGIGRLEALATKRHSACSFLTWMAQWWPRSSDYGHGDFFQRCIACPLPQAVDGDTQCVCTCLCGRDAAGRGHAQIVVAMKFETHLSHPANSVPDHVDHLRGHRQSHGVGNAHPMDAALRCRTDKFVEKIRLRSKGILGAHGHHLKTAQGRTAPGQRAVTRPNLVFCPWPAGESKIPES